jgi:hypothetical protein
VGGIDADAGGDLARAALALARRFAAGGTMWCVAPAWPEHARHVAVEFVHPVIVGARALPAVSVEDADPIGRLRSLVRAGDVLVAVSGGDDPIVVDLLLRAEAWGLMTVWIGAGARPVPGGADHVLWTDTESGAAAHDGTVVLRYHVLWELTHVCFEHPGLLAEPAADEACAPRDSGCITCADEGHLAEVVVLAGKGEAQVRTARGSETVDTSVVGALHPGDLVLVHGGSAIAVVGAERDGDAG